MSAPSGDRAVKAERGRTYNLKPADLTDEALGKKWIVIDAKGAVVGRLAAFAATRLRGKHRPDYTPHVDCGDFVVVVNADQAVFTGNKTSDKVYYRHTGYPGGIRQTTPERLKRDEKAERIIYSAVKRMLPKESPLARRQFSHLRVYAGPEHPHEAQQPEAIDFASLNRKNTKAN